MEPKKIRTTYILSLLSLFFLIASASALPRETHLLALQSPIIFTGLAGPTLYNSNSANAPKNKKYVVDAEIVGLQGISKLGELKIGYDLFYLSDGIMDEGIRRWHDMFSLPQGGRRRIKDDNLRLSFGPNNIPIREGFNVGRTSVGTDLKFEDFVWDFGVTLPGVGNGIIKSGIDPYTTINFESEFITQKINLGLNLLKVGDTSGGGLNFASYRGGVRLDVQTQLFENTSMVTSLLYTSAILSRPESFPDYSILIDFTFNVEGFKFGLRENPAPSAGTEDIVFFIGF